MIVCSCFGTTDREIRAAFGPEGPGDCAAGQGCGNCRPVVEALAAQARCEDTEPEARPLPEAAHRPRGGA